MSTPDSTKICFKSQLLNGISPLEKHDSRHTWLSYAICQCCYIIGMACASWHSRGCPPSPGAFNRYKTWYANVAFTWMSHGLLFHNSGVFNRNQRELPSKNIWELIVVNRLVKCLFYLPVFHNDKLFLGVVIYKAVYYLPCLHK